MTASKPSPRDVVGGAIQNLAAAQLGRGLRPLAMLLVLGLVGAAVGVPGADWVALGAVASGAVMLGHGLRTVQRALGRPDRFWMTLVTMVSALPPVYVVYLVAWRGLRGVATAGGPAGLASAILHAALGVWLLRCWFRVSEIERLTRIMALNVDSSGEPE